MARAASSLFVMGLLALLVGITSNTGRAEDSEPGLLAVYRSTAMAAPTLTRVDLKPALFVDRGSIHPRIPPGEFEVHWTGLIEVRDPGPLTFSAFIAGDLKMVVDGVTVLEGQGQGQGPNARITGTVKLNRDVGPYPLSIRFRSKTNIARLQIWWAGPGFAPEPLPAWRLSHEAKTRPAAVQNYHLEEQGREAARQYGCARCHSDAISIETLPPGPALALGDSQRRLTRSWLMKWLEDPATVRPGAHMPSLFPNDRSGLTERWLIARELASESVSTKGPTGDHRRGRLAFLSVGCAACHFVPDVERTEQEDLGRRPLTNLADRLLPEDLTSFLLDPHQRYADQRMPNLKLSVDQAKDIGAYLLLWSKPGIGTRVEKPSPAEIDAALKRLGTEDPARAARLLLESKGCTACHLGLSDHGLRQIPIRNQSAGCVTGKAGPRFSFNDATRASLMAFLKVAAKETHPSPFEERQRRLRNSGCLQCHQRDTEVAPPIERAGSRLGGAFLQELPFMRTPRLTGALLKLRPDYAVSTVRDGSAGLRGPRHSYRMPAFGSAADLLVRALADTDGELIANPPPDPTTSDPTLATLHGSQLVGFQGYSCFSCHIWKGQPLASQDPGATGPDLTRTANRIRRDWFDRFVEAPLRHAPGTPMPTIFPHGEPATLATILEGNSGKQKDALWAYLALGNDAPSPKPVPPVPVPAPRLNEPAIVAQIPIRFDDGRVVESICVLTSSHDLVVYDLADGSIHSIATGAQILRNVRGRIRQFLSSGAFTDLAATPTLTLVAARGAEQPASRTLLGYDRLADGARIRWQIKFASAELELDDVIQINAQARAFRRTIQMRGVPANAAVETRSRLIKARPAVTAQVGTATLNTTDKVSTLTLRPDRDRRCEATITFELPPARGAAEWTSKAFTFADPAEGSSVRPGYRAIAYPRPKTVSGEDRIMPGALAVRPHDGQLFVASMKTGELFALRDPTRDGKGARFENYAHGLYQDALSMLADDTSLYVLHRRNLTRIDDRDGDGVADRFDRLAALPHGIADTYDMAYGLARDPAGRFVISYAPYANATLPGAGGAIRLHAGRPPEEIAYGMRNPLGWCSGPDGEIFFTDNQGEWVAANKLCHTTPGHYFGFPNSAQKQHISKPRGKTTIWVPYAWARSINGVAYDSTGGKFGPFAGQFFLAELMYGGAIIRANVEKINGVYQGACFPFWGKGLLGPVSLAFDPRGRLYVGSITEPGWMAQPDRGALFAIDFTSPIPFEIQSIHALSNGFRLRFTAPIDPASARPSAFHLEHYRYEYTGSYGSPELDRTSVPVEQVQVANDGMTVDLTIPLIKDRVYRITASGIRSPKGEPLVHPTGAYTLNEIPTAQR